MSGPVRARRRASRLRSLYGPPRPGCRRPANCVEPSSPAAATLAHERRTLEVAPSEHDRRARKCSLAFCAEDLRRIWRRRHDRHFWRQAVFSLAICAARQRDSGIRARAAAPAIEPASSPPPPSQCTKELPPARARRCSLTSCRRARTGGRPPSRLPAFTRRELTLAEEHNSEFADDAVPRVHDLGLLQVLQHLAHVPGSAGSPLSWSPIAGLPRHRECGTSTGRRRACAYAEVA